MAKGISKDLLIEGLKEALREDAKKNVERGTIKLPVDPEEFAVQLQKSPAPGLKHEDYVQAIRDVCKELGLEVIV